MALFYTLEEAASLLGTSTHELRNRIQSKQVHALLIGGSWRLRIADVHGLMRSGHSEISEQITVVRAVRSEPGRIAFSAPESVPPASIPESMSPTSLPESIRIASSLESSLQASTLESVPPASLADSASPASLPSCRCRRR